MIDGLTDMRYNQYNIRLNITRPVWMTEYRMLIRFVFILFFNIIIFLHINIIKYYAGNLIIRDLKFLFNVYFPKSHISLCSYVL